MLCTFIHEKYSSKDKCNLAKAIDDICSPLSNYGWSSAGLYCFWDVNTFEVLYVGLAVDLAERFKQHNGITETDPQCCKVNQLNDYFSKNELIGYSIFVQSSYSQPSCRRFNVRNGLTKQEMEEQYSDLIKQGHETIVLVEGLLIEAHKKATGKKPKWNKVGGSIIGAQKATADHLYLLELFSGKRDDWMIARRSITKLSEDPICEEREEYLHAIRLVAIIHRLSIKDAMTKYHQQDKFNPWLEHVRNEILSKEYLPLEWVS